MCDRYELTWWIYPFGISSVRDSKWGLIGKIPKRIVFTFSVLILWRILEQVCTVGKLKVAHIYQSKGRERECVSWTHLEGMRRESDSRGSSPCHWAPPPPVWTDKVPSVTHTPSPPPGRNQRASEGFCPASCPIWGIPHWKVNLGFWFYIFWQVTGPARQFPCHQRPGPLERSPPARPRAVIPAQDSLRTTEVPYNQFSRCSLRCCLCGSVFTWGESVLLASFLRCCAAAWYTWVFTHGLASPSVKWHEFLSHLAACQSVARCFHVTRSKRFLIGRACNDSAVIHFMLLRCLDRCKPPNRGGARTSETPGWNTPPPHTHTHTQCMALSSCGFLHQPSHQHHRFLSTCMFIVYRIMPTTANMFKKCQIQWKNFFANSEY